MYKSIWKVKALHALEFVLLLVVLFGITCLVMSFLTENRIFTLLFVSSFVLSLFLKIFIWWKEPFIHVEDINNMIKTTELEYQKLEKEVESTPFDYSIDVSKKFNRENTIKVYGQNKKLLSLLSAVAWIFLIIQSVMKVLLKFSFPFYVLILLLIFVVSIFIFISVRNWIAEKKDDDMFHRYMVQKMKAGQKPKPLLLEDNRQQTNYEEE
jgi:hypothetical protein